MHNLNQTILQSKITLFMAKRWGNCEQCNFPYLGKFSYRNQVYNQSYSYRKNFPQCWCNVGYTQTCSQRTHPRLKKNVVFSCSIICIYRGRRLFTIYIENRFVNAGEKKKKNKKIDVIYPPPSPPPPHQ